MAGEDKRSLRHFFAKKNGERSRTCHGAARRAETEGFLRQGCGGQAGRKDGVVFYSASLKRRQAALIFIFAMLY